ncbi:MAG: hypothetical protein ACLU30_11150, partial [Odoribacter splanchnicus]
MADEHHFNQKRHRGVYPPMQVSPNFRIIVFPIIGISPSTKPYSTAKPTSRKFSFSLNKIKTEDAPGILNAVFTTRVFENGGDFSISSQSIRYSPYDEYVGIRLPENDDNWYSTEQPVRLQGVTVTPTGKQSGNATIQIEVYKLDWHWWWDSEDENLGSYVNREYSSSVLSQKVKATDGRF